MLFIFFWLFSTLAQSTLDLYTDYVLEFNIVPESIASNISYFLTLSASGNACCNRGDHVPQVGFLPNSTLMIIDAGVDTSASSVGVHDNANLTVSNELPLNASTHVLLVSKGSQFTVYYNWTLVMNTTLPAPKYAGGTVSVIKNYLPSNAVISNISVYDSNYYTLDLTSSFSTIYYTTTTTCNYCKILL